jgi:putative phosphoribosyl transferase
MYRDRADAGRQLGELLKPYAEARPIVLGLARGGLAVAYEVAVALKAPLAALVVRKIGAPWQPELALGAVADLGEKVVVFNDDMLLELGLSPSDLAPDIARETDVLNERARAFNRVSPVPDCAGRVAIVIDDGIATGATARAALRALRKKGASRTVLAVPVAAADSIEALRSETDEIVCPMIEQGFGAVGAYYGRFDQLSNEDVIDLLTRAKARAPIS